MFKKLFKHELASYMRKLIPIYIAILGVALMGRIVQLFEAPDDFMYQIMFSSSLINYIIVLGAAQVVLAIFCVVRYYRNLFTGEGYLTLCLPITPAQHIWVKLLATTVVEFLTVAVSILSLSVICEGEFFIELIKAGIFLFKEKNLELDGYFGLYIIEGIIALTVMSGVNSLMTYACISLGQRAKKGRIGWAIGAYFIYYLISQTIRTILGFIYIVLRIEGNLDKLARFIENNTHQALQTAFIMILLIKGLFGLLCFVISHTTLTKKLNLE